MNFGIFGSSEDQNKLGDTTKGILIGASSFIIMLATHFHVPLTQNQVIEIAGPLGSAVAAIWTLYGVAKKIFVNTVIK